MNAYFYPVAKFFLNAIIAVTATLLVVSIVVKFVLSTPTVYKNYYTQECVFVVEEKDPVECPKNLPAKYNTVWTSLTSYKDALADRGE